MCTKIEWSKRKKTFDDVTNRINVRGFKSAHNGVLPDLATTDKNKYKSILNILIIIMAA